VVELAKVRSSRPFNLASWRVWVYSAMTAASEAAASGLISVVLISISARTLVKFCDEALRELLRVPARARSSEDLM